MTLVPHPEKERQPVNCAVITVSDTRTPQTDHSGQVIQELLQLAGHGITFYQIIPDEPSQIITLLTDLAAREDIDVMIFNGGTGIAPRDTTYDALAQHLEKTLPGFGELFRWLSYQEIGSRAIASRAISGVYHQKLIFALPGATHGVRLALEKLIIPELIHLTKQIKKKDSSTINPILQ